ncbi:Ig-like domain-containing protein [Clostridium botulinum]|nr:Ig-like domain-containing protein [Clostridium botulinum]
MLKKLILLGVISLSMFISTNANATIFKDNKVVDINKNFTIKFNDIIDSNSLTKDEIIVLDSKENKVKVNLKIGQYSKQIIVQPPNNGYVQGEKYKLIINDKIKSKNNRRLNKNIIMNFSIKENCSDSVNFKDEKLENIIRKK